MKQKKSPSREAGAKAKEQMKMYLLLCKYSKNSLNHQTINELFISITFITLMGLILMKGGVR